MQNDGCEYFPRVKMEIRLWSDFLWIKTTLFKQFISLSVAWKRQVLLFFGTLIFHYVSRMVLKGITHKYTGAKFEINKIMCVEHVKTTMYLSYLHWDYHCAFCWCATGRLSPANISFISSKYCTKTHKLLKGEKGANKVFSW